MMGFIEIVHDLPLPVERRRKGRICNWNEYPWDFFQKRKRMGKHMFFLSVLIRQTRVQRTSTQKHEATRRKYFIGEIYLNYIGTCSVFRESENSFLTNTRQINLRLISL